jgi:hypothetical protein
VVPDDLVPEWFRSAAGSLSGSGVLLDCALTRSDLIADSCQAIAVFIIPMKPPCDVDRWRNPPLP